MPFPKIVKEQAAVACNRCCCICHEFKGIKLEFHHIKQEADGGENTFENCIPLCFDCHADMGGVNPKHPKGNAYSEKELSMHRDKWYEQCASTATGFVEAATRVLDIKDDTRGANHDELTYEHVIYSGTPHNQTVSVEMQNAAGGHTVIIDDEKYIAERIVEEHDREIERLLSEI